MRRRSSSLRRAGSRWFPPQSGAASVSRRTVVERTCKGPRESVTRFKVNCCYLLLRHTANCTAESRPIPEARHYYRHSGQHTPRIPTQLQSTRIVRPKFESGFAPPPEAVKCRVIGLEIETFGRLCSVQDARTDIMAEKTLGIRGPPSAEKVGTSAFPAPATEITAE
jgi:hypothetical protein